MSVQMQSDLSKIKAWMQMNAEETLEYLNPPASKEHILAVEQAIGLDFPDDFKQFLSTHDGESGVIHAFFGNFHMLLPCQEILAQYRLDQDIGRSFYDPERETYKRWQEQVRNRIIFIQGAVKPLMLHPKWIPFTNMNGDVLRYFDYDPAPGGVVGQVIEVDPEGCSWRVLANSFEDLLHQYALDLTNGLYTTDEEVAEGYIVSISHEDVLDWGVPAWLENA